MVELYCELLLARAAVLDQIAFAERGARARNKARNALREQQQAGRADSSSTGSRGFAGFPMPFGGKKQDGPSTTTKTSEGGGKEEGEGNEEEDSYIDPGLDEAAAAIFYACPRFPREVRELATLRALLIERWGKDFAALAQDNRAAVKVPERLVRGLQIRPPPKELVESYLREIAKAYGVAWPKEEQQLQEQKQADEQAAAEFLGSPPPGYNDHDAPGYGDGDLPSTPQPKTQLKATNPAEEALSKATPPRDIGPHDATGRSPVIVAPPGPRSDNPNPKLKIPGVSDTAAAAAVDREESEINPSATAAPAPPAPKKIPEMDELARRFAALKR